MKLIIKEKEDKLMGEKMQEAFAIICFVFARHYKLDYEEQMSMCLSNMFTVRWVINQNK